MKNKITKSDVLRILNKINKRIQKKYLIKQRELSSKKDLFKTITI